MPKSNFLIRFGRLNLGLFIFGIGIAFTVHPEIGLAPWEVFAQGISKQLGITIGQGTIVASAIVLMLWIPLRVKPGLGSVMNAILLGVYADWALGWMPELDGYLIRLVWFIFGMVTIAFATGLYISSNMGKGPRDGLNTGLAKRFKQPFWKARTAVEIVVVTVGFLLGGQVREGTLIFALLIGYLNQLGLRIFGLVDGRGKM